MLIISCLLLFLFLVPVSDLVAQTITFEPDLSGKLPDGSDGEDNTPIRDQFLNFGISFGLDNDLNGIADADSGPFLERVGNDDTTGFLNNKLNQNDAAAPGFENQLGQYFLRTRGVLSTEGAIDTLLVNYTTSVSIASGEIWDIDSAGAFTERWRIEALDVDGVVINTIDSPLSADPLSEESLDGEPWRFEITAPPNTAIKAIRIIFTGTKESGVGLAFNNFSPSSGTPLVDEPLQATISKAYEIFWFSKLGRRYQVQFSSSAEDSAWNNLGAVIDGIGAERSVFVSARSVERRFYRVIEVE